jgi:hypothetical protein
MMHLNRVLVLLYIIPQFCSYVYSSGGGITGCCTWSINYSGKTGSDCDSFLHTRIFHVQCCRNKPYLTINSVKRTTCIGPPTIFGYVRPPYSKAGQHKADKRGNTAMLRSGFKPTIPEFQPSNTAVRVLYHAVSVIASYLKFLRQNAFFISSQIYQRFGVESAPPPPPYT